MHFKCQREYIDGGWTRSPSSTALKCSNQQVSVSEQADALDHVAGVLRQEGIQIGLRIAVVGTPTGDVVDIVVAIVAEVGVVTGVVPGVGVNALNQIDDDSAAQNGLDGLLQSVGTVAEGLGAGEVGAASSAAAASGLYEPSN